MCKDESRNQQNQAETQTPDTQARTPSTVRTETRDQLVEELRQAQQDVVQLLQSMAAAQDWQPEPAEWSFRYVAAHLATVEEECHLHRVRRIAAGDTPNISNYRNRGVDFSRVEIGDALDEWQRSRRVLLDFVAQLSNRELTFIGIHEKLGAVSLLDVLQEMVDQDQGHLRHIRRLIAAYHEDTHPQATIANLTAPRTGQTENGVAPLYTEHKHTDHNHGNHKHGA